MRFETIKASMYLVWRLKYAGLTIQQDGGDIILVELPTGETASIHLIESSIELYEIKSILNDNTQKGYYTLLVLWGDLLLPPEGHLVEPYDWERVLLELYHDRIFAFDIAGSDVYLFAVHFEPEGVFRHIRYGHTLHLGDLTGTVVQIQSPPLAGAWRVVEFASRQTAGEPKRYAPGAPAGLEVYYDLLELRADADLETAKVAYRRLARQYHPDVNPSADATARMQTINDAYTRIMEHFEGKNED